MFNFKKSEIVRPNGQKSVVMKARFAATLTNVSNDVIGVTSGGKDFRVGGIQFKDANGRTQETSCIIYENNFNYGMEVGEDYLATVTVIPSLPVGDKNRLTVTLSHLSPTVTERATEDMFGFASEDYVEETVEEVEELF